MKTRIIALMLALSAAPLALAQDEKKIDLEARKRSVANLEQHLAERNARLAELAEDIDRLDGRVEKRIDRIVDVLKASTDSQDSETKVAETKSQAIQGLRNAIELYAKERANLKEVIRTGKTSIAQDVLAQDVKEVDARIEKRVNQILDLTKSFTPDKQYQKYNTTEEERRFGRDHLEIRINEKWRHNHREAIHTNEQRKEIMEALEKSIADLKSREEVLKSNMGENLVSKSERDFYETDLARLKATISAREEQLNELKEPSAAEANTDEVDSKQAYLMAKSLEDHRADLKKDTYEIFSKYHELNELREQVAAMTKNLKARKAWLEAHGN